MQVGIQIPDLHGSIASDLVLDLAEEIDGFERGEMIYVGRGDPITTWYLVNVER